MVPFIRIRSILDLNLDLSGGIFFSHSGLEQCLDLGPGDMKEIPTLQ